MIILLIKCLVSDAFSKSVILNKAVGDATLILNNSSLIYNNYLFNRVLTSIIQFCTVNPYPPKTPSLNRIYKEVLDEFIKYKRKLLINRDKIPVFSNILSDTADASFKRIDLAQHTLSGASVYALSKNDSCKRLTNFLQRSGKKLEPGPALLIQREFPSKKELQFLNGIVHDFNGNQQYLWDERIFLSVKLGPGSDFGFAKSLKFMIKPLCTEIVKEFEKLTKNDFSCRKNLYSYLGLTPGSHLHTIPVLYHVDSDYMAIPTLFCYSDKSRFIWEFYNSSTTVYTSKFMCLP